MESPPLALKNLEAWLAKGHAGDMAWLERQKEKRLDPTLVLPGAKSVISVGLVYNTDRPYSTETSQPWVSRYAWGDDYHGVMKEKLSELEALLKKELPSPLNMRSYSDTGPVSEKAWAAASGIGWIGKNSNLINPKLGSWFFLGEILTDLDLAPDQPAEDLCGSCDRCIKACPTQAFSADYELDARRCISYLTIEKRGAIPEEFHEAIGLNLYGCDICQDVCPWNHWKLTGQHAAFAPRPENWDPDVEKLKNISDEEFARVYHGSAIKRSKAEGMRRNAAIVSKNLNRT